MAPMRAVAPEDLLRRPRIALDAGPLHELIDGKRVLVTGAGGWIGSELCRQIAQCQPAALAMLDRAENGLHAVAVDLAHLVVARPVIGDVTDAARLEAVCDRVRPDIVFHAAAHKHVPLMELHPSEAVKNNVTGTRRVAEAAIRCGASRMVLISTDKAVDPTSIMGASKAVAELVVRHLAERASTRVVTVRFGNVLGSSGSVLPRFLQQIAAGGPVTVTHPEVQRYFMLTSEAVELVLQAAALKTDPKMCVLDLGEPIRIAALARDVIGLAGYDPDGDMPVTFIGLRPGEKLLERLVGPEERTLPTSVGHLLTVEPRSSPLRETASAITALEGAAADGDDIEVVGGLCACIPSFAPSAVWRGRPASEQLAG
jgi:FlaA1/EpsC-like NDP-sugar epimerase